jgi:hypothetical protein
VTFTGTSYSFRDVTANHTISVTFAINTYTIVPSASAHGSITPSITQTVDYGAGSSFTFTPDAGYRISDLKVDGVSVGALTGYDFTNVAASHTIAVSFASADKSVARIGTDMYGTAVALAKKNFPNSFKGVKRLVLASGEAAFHSDPMVAAGLAGAYGAPEMLVGAKTIPASVTSAIKSMPKGVKISVVGNESAVSHAVLVNLAKIKGVGSVDRVGGADRYAVAANVARKMNMILGAQMPKIGLIADGAKSNSLYDVLDGSVLSNHKHFALLLTNDAAVPAVTTSAINSIGLTDLYVLGSTSAVPDAARITLGIDPSKRIGGPRHYETAALIADRAVAEGWLGRANVGFTARLTPALTAGAFMGSKNGAILYTLTSSIPTVTSSYLTTNHYLIGAGYVLGNTANIDAATRASLQALIQ